MRDDRPTRGKGGGATGKCPQGDIYTGPGGKRARRVITVNIYRTWGEALQTFDYISRECHWGPFESAVVKYAGAVIMYFIAKRMISKYGLEGDVRGLLFG